MNYNITSLMRLAILKQPLHTSIAIDTLEFAEFSVEEMLHIVISVKDFKSIVTHAGSSNTIVTACYSRPASPMQLTYGDDEGMLSEFILMTMGEVRANSMTPASNPSRVGSKRPASRQPLEATSSSRRAETAEMAPPPPRVTPARTDSSRSRDPRPSPPPPQPSIHSDALFIPRADDDVQWDPVNHDDEDEDMLLWDQGPDNVGGHV